MAEAESVNTMFQNAFQKVADGEYALQITGVGGGVPTTVSLDQTDPNNKVRIADGQIITIAEPLASRATSVTANGKVTSPAANAAIATTANLSTGTWDIEAITFITGTTVAATEVDNCKFNIGATPVATIVNPVPGTTGASATGRISIRVNLAAPTPVSVIAGAAGTTNAVYVASIVATKWENP